MRVSPIGMVLAMGTVCAHADIPILIEEQAGYARVDESVTLGLPLVQGQLASTDPVRIVDGAYSPMDAQFSPMAYWSDGSIKFLKCDFQASVGANGTAEYAFQIGATHTFSSELNASESATEITITTGSFRFVVSKVAFNIIDRAWLDLDDDGLFEQNEQVILQNSPGPRVTEAGITYHASAGAPAEVTIDEEGPMKVVIRASGVHYNGPDYLLKYETRIYAYRDKSYLRVCHVYANGISVDNLAYPLDPSHGASFDRYWLDMDTGLVGSKTVRFGGDGGAEFLSALGTGQTASLLQADRIGTTPPLSYTISMGGAVVDSGSRAAGWGCLSDNSLAVTIASRYFWQNYPKALVLDDDGRVSFEPSPTEEYFWIGMGTGDDMLFYFHPSSAAPQAGATVMALTSPLVPRAAPEQYAESRAFYALLPGESPYEELDNYIDVVTDNHLANCEDRQLYGNINFGDVPVDYWGVDESELDATGWGNNYYDGGILTPVRLFVQTGDARYPEIFFPAARHFMETDCWNTYDPDDWLNGYCPAYSSYHRATAHFQHHYGEGSWYYYYLTGDERGREVGLRAANAIVYQQYWGNENVDCRMAYQRGSTCIEAYKATQNVAFLNHAKHLLVDKIMATQDVYGLIGASYEGSVVGGEQTFMMALFSDSFYKYILELPQDSRERIELSLKLALLADFIDTYARKNPGQEEYWNFFDAPNNNSPPQPDPDNGNPDATVYWGGKGLICGTYAYAYDVTGDDHYRSLAESLLDHMWTVSVIDWGGSEFWMKPSSQCMKNMLHAVALVSETCMSWDWSLPAAKE